MKARYIQAGNVIDFVPAQDVNAGEVVRQGNIIGVTSLPTAAGTLGGLAVNGVFEVEKKPAAVFSVSDRVFWNFTSGQAETSGDVVLGFAVKAASAGTAKVIVLLNAANAVSENVSIEWKTL